MTGSDEAQGRQTPRRGVHCDGLTGLDLAHVRDILALVGGTEWTMSYEDSLPALVCTQDAQTAAHWAGLAVATVRIGERGSLRLPQDNSLLAQIIASTEGATAQETPPGSRSGRLRASWLTRAWQCSARAIDASDYESESGRTAPIACIGVCGWNGGAGASTLAHRLAARAGGVLIDASGSAPGIIDEGAAAHPGLRWCDIDPAENAFAADFITHLPESGSLPFLAGDAGGVADPVDPRLIPVIDACRRGIRTRRGAGDHPLIVVDAGRWGEGAHRGSIAYMDALVLVGHSGLRGASVLACSYELWTPELPHILVFRGGHREHIEAAAPGAPLLSYADASGSRALRFGRDDITTAVRRLLGRHWANRFTQEAS